MSDSIKAFTVPLGLPGSEYSEQELGKRLRRARADIVALFPAIKNLYHSLTKETIITQNNQLILKVVLIDARQMSIDFNPSTSLFKKLSPILQKLIEDRDRLFESAESSQIRVSELVNLIATNPLTKDPDNSIPNVEFSKEDMALLKLIHTKSGKAQRYSLPDHNVDFQIPLIPKHTPESGTRKIRALIKSISPTIATLNSIRLIEDVECTSKCKHLLSGTMKLHRPKIVGNDLWGLLYAAADREFVIEVEVKVALLAHTLNPSYLELRSLINKKQLRDNFDMFCNTVKGKYR